MVHPFAEAPAGQPDRGRDGNVGILLELVLQPGDPQPQPFGRFGNLDIVESADNDEEFLPAEAESMVRKVTPAITQA